MGASSCVTWGHIITLSVPWFPHMGNGTKHRSHLTSKCEGVIRAGTVPGDTRDLAGAPYMGILVDTGLK